MTSAEAAILLGAFLAAVVALLPQRWRAVTALAWATWAGLLLLFALTHYGPL